MLVYSNRANYSCNPFSLIQYTALRATDVVLYKKFRERLPTNKTECIWIPTIADEV